MALNQIQQEGLKQFLNFINIPQPEGEEGWEQFEKRVTRLYRRIAPDVPPLPPQAERRQWMQRVQLEARAFIQVCHDTLTAQKITDRSLASSSDKGAVSPILDTT